MRICCYLNCQNRQNAFSKNSGIRFHKFPKNEKRCVQWLNACQNSELINVDINLIQTKCICSDHFPSFSYINPLRKNKVLKETAIPIAHNDQKFKVELIDKTFVKSNNRWISNEFIPGKSKSNEPDATLFKGKFFSPYIKKK